MTPNDIPAYMAHVGAAAREASRAMARASLAARNAALVRLAQLLRAEQSVLMQANRRDLDAAGALAAPLRDRLRLDEKSLATVATGCEQIAAMADPVGEIVELKRQPSGIQVGRMRVPIGVFGMIYESRPNVTIEAASLAIKSGNAAILRGGSESFHSSQAIHACLVEGLRAAQLPEAAIQLVPTTDREAVGHRNARNGGVGIDLEPREQGTWVRFSHRGWPEASEHYRVSCHCWAMYLRVLRRSLEEGESVPYERRLEV